ncbi:hypothetical protein R9C00_04640 [Flammeovirgaceae bacterium SG7u.111]|nr:hypothetical protein [Flammeovirgaceae bacterium SG7u.132]WPO36734.1 hypothetical protein R9C00_04640 [Flammeovirgaceae bacterium SG7u.111]
MIKQFLLLFFSAAMMGGGPDDVAKVNDYKKKAETAYLNQEFEEAAAHYQYLLDTLEVTDPHITLNLAHSYYKTGKTEEAASKYSEIAQSDIKELRSVANQQVGVILAEKQKYKEALSRFKEALKANPANEEARYNYELVKKLSEEQEQKQDKDQKKDKKDQEEQKKDQEQEQKDQQEQQNKDQQQQEQEQEQQEQEQQQQNQEEGEQSQEQGEEQQEQEQPQDPQQQEGEQEEQSQQEQDQQQMKEQRLDEIKMTEEMAKMILEAMRNNEVQYYQQMKRKSKKRDNGKPDW